MRRHYWKYFGPLTLQKHSGVTDGGHVFTFTLPHVIIIMCNCCWSFACAGFFCLSSPLTPSSLSLPPGSEASLGNSLNTSEEELHTAGIALAPKGTRDSHQPISIQIAPRSCSDHYHFCSDHYHSHTKASSTLGRGLFCFYTTKLLPLWLRCLSPLPSRSLLLGLFVPLRFAGRQAQVCLNDTDCCYIWMDENKEVTRRCHSLCLCFVCVNRISLPKSKTFCYYLITIRPVESQSAALSYTTEVNGDLILNIKSIKWLHTACLAVIQASGSPEIPNWFWKMLFTFLLNQSLLPS